MNVAEYRRWFDYEQDSNAKVLASLRSVPEDLRSSASFQKAVDLMGHLVAARSMWLYRLGSGSAPADLFPTQTLLSELPQLIADMHNAWSDYFAKLTDERLAFNFEYQSYDGPRFRNTIEDVLTQLYGHALSSRPDRNDP